MNFYKRFIGDIQRDTGHLSLSEFGAYDRLLDHYYATETPLPSDIDACCRIARAMTKDERKAVSFILSQYFTKGDAGYIQKRVEKELSEAQPKIEANKANGLLGGRPKGSKNKTQEKPSGFSELTHSEPSDNLSQSHSQNTVISNIESDCNVPMVFNDPLTLKGQICKSLVSIGLPPFNVANPKFDELLKAEPTVDEFVQTAIEIRRKDPSKFNFDYLLGVLIGRRLDAAVMPKLHKGEMHKTSREAGRNAAAKSIFTPENTRHLQGNLNQKTEIEVLDEEQQRLAN